MKKLIVALFAVMMMVFSAVPVFAAEATASVTSPVATTAPETSAATTPVSNPDKGNESPKTGSNSDMLAYALIAASVIGCGAASAVLVKMAKKN